MQDNTEYYAHSSCRIVNKTHMKKQSLFSNSSSCLGPSCRRCLASRPCNLRNCQIFLSKHDTPFPNTKYIFRSWVWVIIAEKHTRTHSTFRIRLSIKICFISSITHNTDQFSWYNFLTISKASLSSYWQLGK